MTGRAGVAAAAEGVPDRATLRAWRNAVLTIFWLSGLVFATWAARVPTVRDILGASPAEMGLVLLGLAVGALAGLVAASHIVARLGATRTILVLFLTACAGLVVTGLVAQLTPSIAAIAVALAIFGAGTSITDVAMNLSGAADERALGRTVMPLFHASFSLGTVVGAAVSALMLLLRVPVLAHLAGVAALSAVVLLVLVRFLQPAEEPAAHGDEPSSWRGRLRVWRDPRVLLIGLVVLGMASAEGSANDWLALAMVDGHDFSNAGGAVVLGVFVAAMTVGRVLGAPLLDRFGRVPVLRASAALAALGLAVVILVPNDATAVVGVVAWGLGASLGFPVGISAAADDPASAAASVSAVSTIGYVAFLVGPPVIGVLGERFGLLRALTVVLVVIVLAGAVAGATGRRPA